MTTATQEAQKVYSYRAQTADGKALTGTVDAVDGDDAQQQLEAMRLRVLELVEAPSAGSSRALSGETFQAFNHQLAMLTQAGLPLEKSLRMISRDIGSRRLSATIDAVATELERGTPLADAFKNHQSSFPPLYGQLIAMGLRTGRLPAVLLSLGRHVELVQRLRSAVWQATAYPLILMLLLIAVMLFLGLSILPQFEAIFADMNVPLPLPTQWLLDTAVIMPFLAIGLAGCALAAVAGWWAARIVGCQGVIVDLFARFAPMVGPVLRRSLAMRWCDMMRLGIEAGMDLPAALRAAGDAVNSPALRRDSLAMADALSRGETLSEARPLRILPEGVPMSMELAAGQGNLAGALESLAALQGRQAELRLGLINAVLLPTLLLSIGAAVALVVVVLVLPLVSLLEGIV